MTDRYTQIVNSSLGRPIARQLGLPTPARLRRHRPGEPFLTGPVLLAGDGHGSAAARKTLDNLGATVHGELSSDDERYAAIVLDATELASAGDLRLLFDVLHPAIRRLGTCARVVLLGAPPADATDAPARAAQQALDGFMRSVGKELRAGGTANLLEIPEGAEDGVDAALRFLLSGRSAYVSGQVIHLTDAKEPPEVPADWDRPLDGKVAVVTGAAQGIGAAIASTLARDGAHVVALDLPSQGDALTKVANRIGGSTLQLDITADDAPDRLTTHLDDRHGGADIVIHNAGVTRDKTMAGMDERRWDQVLGINLEAQLRLTDALLTSGTIGEHGRVVSVSSVMGIAGNRGQSNYAASKAGIIGMVEALAPTFAERRATINAVAPGFIETAMTDEMPLAAREVGRRTNSLGQGGLPLDVAETVGWLAWPATAHVNGQTVRVCGQMLLGA